MSFDSERLYRLLPAIYRIRDAEQGKSPLKALLSVIDKEIGVLEDNLAQLYDDQFIETCAEWVVPYIGDLLGVSKLQPIKPGTFSQRAFVANAMAYWRRKGTAVMLEQLARDVTGCHVHVVEFFRQLVMTQSMHHLRQDYPATPDLRKGEPLEHINTPFNSIAHTVDVRRIARRRGRYNIPNIGIFLWRLQAYSLTASRAYKVNKQCYMFSPLGNNTLLFTHPGAEGEFVQLSAPADVPMAIDRRILDTDLGNVRYEPGPRILLNVGNKDLSWDKRHKAPDEISVCDLRDIPDESGKVTWAHMPEKGGKIAIDPVLGRIAFPPDKAPKSPKSVRVTYYYGFSAPMGGGEYDRTATFDPEFDVLQRVPEPTRTIQGALDALSASGVIEIGDSGRYEGKNLTIDVPADHHILLRAASKPEGRRPTLVLSGDMSITGHGGPKGARVTLNGLLITGSALRISGQLQMLRLQHCTLVPGLSLDRDGRPQSPSPSFVIQTDQTYPLTVEIDHCIVGPLRMPAEGVTLQVKDSIIDAPAMDSQPAMAISGDDNQPGPLTTMERCTVMGRVHLKELELVSNTIFMDTLTIDRRQAGQIRFSYVPDGSSTPRRHRCQPDLAVQQALDAAIKANPLLTEKERQQLSDRVRAYIKPSFTERAYGRAAYAQLELDCPVEIRAGSDDGSEMGAFHELYQSQREANLLSLLDEFLRFGLEAGIFYVT